jgi:hypothetical protein
VSKPIVRQIINCFADPVLVAIYGGTYVNGEYISILEQEFTLRCSIQELEGKDLKFVKEGTRVEEHRKLYSEQPLPVDPLLDSNGINDVRFKIGQEVYRLVGTPQWFQDYSVFIVMQLQANIDFPIEDAFRITEDGDQRVTEGGDLRVTE